MEFVMTVQPSANSLGGGVTVVALRTVSALAYCDVDVTFVIVGLGLGVIVSPIRCGPTEEQNTVIGRRARTC
jgi:formate-dependent nitrite reductase membrane component NrfD